MKEARLAGARAALAPMRERGLEQHVGADHIGADEFGRAVNRAVHVALCRKMHHRVRVEAREGMSDVGPLADVGAAELVASMAVNRRKRGEIARISQLVEDHHVVSRVCDEVADDGRTDEARSSRDNDPHALTRGWPASLASGMSG